MLTVIVCVFARARARGLHTTWRAPGSVWSQRQDQGAVFWVQAPTRTVCQQEALLGEARVTAGSWVLQMGLGVCLSGGWRGQGTTEPCVAGRGECQGRAWPGPVREPEGSREPGSSKQGGDLVSV